MIKSIVFDWGGVISPAGTPDEVVTSLSELLSVSENEARAGFSNHAEKFKRGLLSEEDFWKNIEKEFNVKIEDSNRSIWTDVEYFKPDVKINSFVDELKNLGYNVSILSNTFPPTAESIRHTGWYDKFDTDILSSEIKMAKPDTEIYDFLLNETKFKPEECVFIDDQERCLAPARKMGMTTVLALSTQQIIEDVSNIVGL